MHRCFRLLLAPLLLATSSIAIAVGVGESDRQTWFVSFAEPPLASYRGPAGGALEKSIGLKATSPAVTGAARLDVESKASRDYRGFLAQRRGARLAAAASLLGRSVSAGFVYDVVNNAVSLSLTADEAARLAKLPGVIGVERETVQRLHTDAGPAWIGAEQVWNAGAGLGTRGEGRVVGIIDSGINRSHPAFAAAASGYQHVNPRAGFIGLCATNAGACNAKLIGMHDFTLCTGTHNTDGCDDREPNDGTDVDGHGSHVASTAVGNPLTYSIALPSGAQNVQVSGVAPRANLVSYKACELEEDCRGTWLLAAVNQAVADGVDVVNYSIGGDAFDPWQGTTAKAMLAARAANVLIVSSAGNDGPIAGSVGSPANAPWVLAVANMTHDRVIANRLVDLSGGDGPAPSGGVLVGAGQTAGYGPAPLVIPLDFPGCSIGEDLDSPPNGSSNPWSPGRFSGQIVVCQRGVQARVAKSNNVRLAGGGGMVLVNQQVDGESTVADAHSIPGTHLGFTNGSALVAWLSSGSGHRGRIEGSRVLRDATFADRLANSSARGPVEAGDFLKPALGAPGSSILAAAGTGTGSAFLSGTSMASPHVTGAFALLKSARPTWTLDDIESALVTTALPVVTLADGVTPATAFEQGAGRVALQRALQAGLGFPVTKAEFEAANPAAGGDPRQLNQPSIIDSDCVQSCEFSRDVRDIAGGGSWVAEVDMPDGVTVTVTPSQFTLAAGAMQTLQFQATFDSPALLGRWSEGSVTLRRAGDSTVTPARLPVMLFSSPGAVPERFELNVAGERGHQDVGIGDFVALSDLRYSATKLAVPRVTVYPLTEDPTNGDPYDNIGAGSNSRNVNVPAGAGVRYRFTATTRSATSPDVDLFVGLDADADGQPEEAEELCSSATSTAAERCEFEVVGTAAAQSVWVLVQNWDAGPSGTDDVTLETALVDLTPATDGGLVVTGPSTVAADAAFPLRLIWDEPTLLDGQSRLAAVFLSIGDGQPFAEIPVTLTRSGATMAPRALVSGRTQPLALPAGAAQDRLFIDVPANASALVLATRSTSQVDLYAARADIPAGPATGQAPPRSAAQASAVGAGGNESLRISGAALQPGRWFVTPVNTGTGDAALELDVSIEYGSARVPLQPGAYFNPARSGAGAFLYEIGDAWGFIWYTYLQDGTPTWYLGAAPAPTVQQGVWRVPLDRFVWNGSEAVPTTVGEALLSFSTPGEFQFGWNLDGESGSETYRRIDTGSCPQSGGTALDASGIWFPPSRPGIGYSINVGEAIETVAAYAYDDRGVARWLFGASAPFGADSFALEMYAGFCPLCDYEAPATAPVGTFTRSYDSGSSGTIGMQFTLLPPLSGSWNVSLPSVRLTDSAGCQ